jgi:hypothetical protein
LAHVLVGEPEATSPEHALRGTGVGRAMRKFVLAGVGCAALALAGCSTGQLSMGTSFWVQPGKYDFLKCPDLASRWMSDSNQEKQLLSLMERADQEAVGPVVNLMVYRADLEQLRADMALLQQTARDKGCENLVQPPRR